MSQNGTNEEDGKERTLSVAIFIHSSKLELIISRGRLSSDVGSTELSCCFCFAALEPSGASFAAVPSDDGPAKAFSTTVILVLFLLLRFSAASSLMLTDLRGTRTPAASWTKLASLSGLYTSLSRFLIPDLCGLGVSCSVSGSDSLSDSVGKRARRAGAILEVFNKGCGST